MTKYNVALITLVATACISSAWAGTTLVPIGKAWARNSVNANILRHNSVVSHGNNQYAAYYDASGFVVLAKRKVGFKKWTTKRTQYKGNVKDAHNSISIMVDGEGYLHMSWDHHGHQLRYCRSSVSAGTQNAPVKGTSKCTTYKEDSLE